MNDQQPQSTPANDSADQTTNPSDIDIYMTPVVSSQIAEVGYNAAANVLAVRFKPKTEDEPRRVYHYQDVPAEVFDEFMDSSSLGSYFYKKILGVYGFKRIEADGTISKETGPKIAADEPAAA